MARGKKARRQRSRLIRSRWLGAAAGLVLWVGSDDLTGQSLAQAPRSEPESAPAIAAHVLNKHTVQLPIHLEDRFRPLVKEIQLYYKEQPSAPWTLRDKAPPTQASFTFKASHDGEYFFMMATVDREGHSVPADVSKEEPAMVIILDTQPPVAEVVFVGTGPEGQLIQCDVRDAHPDLTRTRVQYQTADRMYRDMEALPDRPNVYCIPPQANITGQIRASVADLAGNVTTRACALGQLPTPAQVAKASPRPTPVQSVTTPLPTSPAPAVAEQKMKGPQLSLPDKAIVQVEAQTGPGKSSAPRTMPSENPSNPPRPLAPNLGSSAPIEGSVVQGAPLAPVVTVKSASAAPSAADAPIPNDATTVPHTDPGHASNANLLPTGPTLPAVAHKHETGSAHHVLVNNTHVFLDYRIEQAGPSGIGCVEIWCTHDRGQSWRRIGEDMDRKSPAEAQLPGDGVYGLTLVVSNGLGFGGQPPAPGDAPDWWIEVDTTQPSAQITMARMSHEDGPVVEIGWTSHDRNLGSTPAELSYAVNRQGPWVPIAKGLKGDGQFHWVPPADVGQQAFLRLTVRDLAGNCTITEATEPITLDDLSRPRAFIAGISTDARTAPAPQK
jgi:hypothetical protein